MHAFRDVETASYCPRKLYYRRAQPAEQETPELVERRRELAFEYDCILAKQGSLTDAPITVTPTQFRSRLGSAKARLDEWEQIVEPADRNVFLSGRECQGTVHKLLDCSSPSLSLVFGGKPPQQGVWKPQSVRLMAAAKALSWEREAAVEFVFAEYPACGVIRKVAIDARRTAQYRKAVRTAEAIDGPPARTKQRSKCDPCEYQSECGVRTRSLRSILGG